MTEKRKVDPLKVTIFIVIIVFYAIFFTADDITGIGEALDPIEFMLALLIGAGFAGKVGFTKAVLEPEPQKAIDVPAVDVGPKPQDKATKKGGKKKGSKRQKDEVKAQKEDAKTEKAQEKEPAKEGTKAEEK